ncbi:hypothetical protein [Absidia glauca]|uniref:GH16 domain-containing protein n=1 Tax=Absidia glauca TaxID=4829 RepID=A0A168MY54_ABSGL|nr:hypothetical protein [Absidia glauca]
MVFRLTLTTLLGLSVLQGLVMSMPTKRSSGECTPFSGNFGDSSEWSPEEDDSTLYSPITNGLKFNLVRPDSYTVKKDPNEGSDYNTKAGRGPTFVYNTDVQYGVLTAKVKAPSVGGTVTAIIFKSSTKDEIDYELIAAPDNVQTNYYWGKKVEQGKNDAKVMQSISDDYHTYSINWSPEAIKWSIDGEVVREVTKESTDKGSGPRYPTSPSQIQIGLWDGSDAAGTAAWAQGPIKPFVKQQKNKAYFKRYQVKYRRRREGKTDYYARKRLVVQAKNKYNSPKYRLVVRFTNKDIVCQIVYAKLQGDFVLSAAYAHELPRFGIKGGLTNWAAAYATGLLLARRTLTKLGLADKYEGVTEADGALTMTEANEEGPRPFKAFLDVGLARTSTGARVFGAMKGASDGGIFVPHSGNRFPEEDEERYKKHFAGFIKAGVTSDALEDMYSEAHEAIRADPVHKPVEKKALPAKPYRRPQRLNKKQRDAKVAEKIAAFHKDE